MPQMVINDSARTIRDGVSRDDWATSSKHWFFESVKFVCPACGATRIAKDVSIQVSFALLASFGSHAYSAVLRNLVRLAPDCYCDRNRFRLGCELQRRARMVRLKKP